MVSHEAAVGADAADQVVPAEAAQLGAVAVASVAAVETAASTTNASAPNAAARRRNEAVAEAVVAGAAAVVEAVDPEGAAVIAAPVMVRFSAINDLFDSVLIVVLMTLV